MTDAESSTRGSKLTRSGTARIRSYAIPDSRSSSVEESQSSRIPATGREQQIYDDGKIRSCRRTKQNVKDIKETVEDTDGPNLKASSEGLEALRAVIPAERNDPSVRNSVEVAPKKANASKSATRFGKRAKTVATKVKNAKEISANTQYSENSVKPTTNIENKADVEVQAKPHRSKPSTQKRKLEEITIKGEEGKDSPGKSKRKRKTKEEKEAETMPLAARSTGLRMFVGAHVSAAKGVHNAITNSVHIGGNAFALFLKSQRKWENPPLQDEHKIQFKALTTQHKYDAARHILPHGSYLVNLAQEDTTKAQKAYTAFIDDLHRCQALGIKLYNFHPGFTGSSPRAAAIARIATHLNAAHMATDSITTLLETMAGAGNVIGSTFTDLRDIIALVRDKSRIGVCLDTCHIFAAGYDLRSPDSFAAVLEDFERTVGLRYLKALHLNDSKTPLGSHRDLHANIGTGFLGLSAFWNVMNERRFEGLPMVLETPIDREDADGKAVEDKGVWAREIKLLEGLVGMEMDEKAFRVMETELAQGGQADREKHQSAFERKVAKEAEDINQGKGKRKRRTRAEESESEG